MAYDLSRRSALKGVMRGAAVAVGVPLLDVFLDGNGEALAATGAPVPIRFGTWFWGLGREPQPLVPHHRRARTTTSRPSWNRSGPMPARSTCWAISTCRWMARPTCPTSAAARPIRTGRALTAERGLPGESFDVTISDLDRGAISALPQP